MNKKIVGIGFIIAMIVYLIIGIILICNSHATSLDKQTIFQYNGKEFQTGSFKYNNRIYVPLRTISNEFGYNVKWNADDKTITISDNKSYIQFQIRSKSIFVYNADSIIMDVEPLVINGRTYIPIRYAIEPLGKFINYYEDAKVRIINITDTKLIEDTVRWLYETY